jgi:hypothetical protein
MISDKLTILAFGPLTNLALAIRTDPSIKDCIKEIYGMGGNIEGKANIRYIGTYNKTRIRYFGYQAETEVVILSTYIRLIFQELGTRLFLQSLTS